MGNWTFLTNHARVLLLLTDNRGARLRDLAAALDITERTAFGVLVDLTEAGYVLKERHGRRNRYEIQANLSLREPISPNRTIGEVLDVLVDARSIARRADEMNELAGGVQHDGPSIGVELEGGKMAVTTRRGSRR